MIFKPLQKLDILAILVKRIRCECGAEFKLRHAFKHMLFCKNAKIEADEEIKKPKDS
jgi:hypothetical protein